MSELFSVHIVMSFGGQVIQHNNNFDADGLESRATYRLCDVTLRSFLHSAAYITFV